MARLKPHRVRLVVKKTVRVLVNVEAASPKHAIRLAKERFERAMRDAKGLGDIEDSAGTEDLGWELSSDRKGEDAHWAGELDVQGSDK